MQWIWFTIILQPLYNILIVFYKYLGSDIGIAIIALTILIRMIFWPLQGKALRSTREQQAIQPEIEKIKEKYKSNPQKQSQEILTLFRTHKVSPLSGCLPVLIQFPILIGLYSIFVRGLKTETFSWLYSFIKAPTSLNTYFFHWVDLAQPEKIFFPILAGLTQFILAWLTNIQMKQFQAKKKDPSKPDFTSMFSKQMLYIFPIMIVFISMKLPAALSLYWIITNIFMIVQQYLINKSNIGLPKTSVKVKSRS